MILTWLWKLVLWFRQGGDPPALEAPKTARRSDDLGFINQSTDKNNADPMIFGGRNDPLSPPKP